MVSPDCAAQESAICEARLNKGSAIALGSSWLRESPLPRLWEDSTSWWEGHFAYEQTASKYNAQEVSMDFFGSYLNPEGKFSDLFKTSMQHGYWGGGAG